jgi:hypothetical protein
MPQCCTCSKEVSAGNYVEIAERTSGRGIGPTEIRVYCNACASQRAGTLQTAGYVLLVAFIALAAFTLFRFL